MEYNFTFDEPATGLLTPESVHFFYYTVAKKELENETAVYEWDKEIGSYLTNQDLCVRTCPIEDLPSEFGNSELLFEKIEIENEAEAFIRHLRNAFAHYHIGEYGDYYKMEDFNNLKQRTMIGKIKIEHLKQLCYLLLKQGEIFNVNTGIVNFEES